MNRDGLISVIIPIYNSEKYLKDCIESVVNQTYPNIEIILINDGSTDRSPEICRCYAQKDNRIVFISQENKGEAAARNHGLSVAQGDLLMFVDSDDLLARDACEHVCREMRDYDLMILDYQMFHSISKIQDVHSDPETDGVDLCQYSRKDWVCSQLGPARTIPDKLNLNTVWAKAYRRRFIEEHGIEFPRNVLIGPDMLFNLDVYLNGPRVCGLSVKSYFYRYNPGSVVHRYNPDYKTHDHRFMEALESILAQEDFREEIQKGLDHQKTIGFFQILSSDIFHRNNPKSAAQKKADFLSLVNDGGYCGILIQGMKCFPPVKRFAMFFSAKKQYLPIKVVYFTKDLLNEIRRKK